MKKLFSLQLLLWLFQNWKFEIQQMSWNDHAAWIIVVGVFPSWNSFWKYDKDFLRLLWAFLVFNRKMLWCSVFALFSPTNFKWMWSGDSLRLTLSLPTAHLQFYIQITLFSRFHSYFLQLIGIFLFCMLSGSLWRSAKDQMHFCVEFEFVHSIFRVGQIYLTFSTPSKCFEQFLCPFNTKSQSQKD